MRKIVYACSTCRCTMAVVDHLEIEDAPLPETVKCDSDDDLACGRGEAYRLGRKFPPTIVATHETYLDQGRIAIRRKP